MPHKLRGLTVDQFVVVCGLEIGNTVWTREGLACLCYLVYAASPNMTRPSGINHDAGIEAFRIAVEQSPFIENAPHIRFDENAKLIDHALNSIRATTAFSNRSMARTLKHLAKSEHQRIEAAAHAIEAHPEQVMERGVSLRQIEELLRPEEA